MSISNLNSKAEPEVSDPNRMALSVLAALSEGKISKAVDQFDDHFTYIGQALGLEFVDKRRLIEFFHKSRELFPDTVVRADATFECRDHAIVEWKLSSTQTLPYGPISTESQFPAGYVNRGR